MKIFIVEPILIPGSFFDNPSNFDRWDTTDVVKNLIEYANYQIADDPIVINYPILPHFNLVAFPDPTPIIEDPDPIVPTF